MFIFDQLKKDDPRLRVLTVSVLAGLVALLIGLWWVQIVMARTYQSSLETQSYRSVRIPAVRGRILDRNGTILAENRPTYNISLYLEELRPAFDAAYVRLVTKRRAELKTASEARARELRRELTRDERRPFILTLKEKNQLRVQARAEVASNLVAQVSTMLGQPVPFDPDKFERHHQARLYVPCPILEDLNSIQIALFMEKAVKPEGVDLEVQTMRIYPLQTTAAHALGRLRRDDSSMEGEDAFFSYRLPDFRGLVGLEGVHDQDLRGSAGAKSVLVNNVGYRQTDRVWEAAEPGYDLVTTLDSQIQEAAERALYAAYGQHTRGAAVVMNVETGDILAMASSPTLNPNHFIQGFPPGEWKRINDLRAEVNRATHSHYAPGSIFKIIVGLAALEDGLNPNAMHHALPNPDQPGKAIVYVGRLRVKDTTPPGDYNFKRALKLSSNSYFIHAALRTGPKKIVELGQKLHFGERTGIMPMQEAPGAFPSIERVTRRWTDGNTANLAIGQDPVLVTPVQVAVMTAAVANGGRVLWPRLADRLEPQENSGTDLPLSFPHLAPRSNLGVKPSTLDIVREAMLADVEESDGTGRKAAVPGLRICGKTGTAQNENLQGHKTGQTTWFASFAPYEKPKYAVVVVVEDGASGGETCAPIAGKIYSAILASERKPANVAAYAPR